MIEENKNKSYYISRYLSNKDQDFCVYILEFCNVLWSTKTGMKKFCGCFLGSNEYKNFDNKSLRYLRCYFERLLQGIESSNKSGMSSYEIDQDIKNIGICKRFLVFFADLEKFYKLFKKKGIETEYFEILSIFRKILTESRLEYENKILNSVFKIISKNLGESVSTERVIREFFKLSSPIIDYIDLIPELLDKFDLEYNESEVDEIKQQIQDEIDLEEFGQNFASPQEVNIGNFTELQGYEFENYLKNLFELLGYGVIQTSFSADQGADLIVSKDNEKTVVQAKKYNGKVSNKAIQEVVAAKNHYKADKAMVITNSSFTKSAIDLSLTNDVELWDGEKLRDIVESLKISKK